MMDRNARQQRVPRKGLFRRFALYALSAALGVAIWSPAAIRAAEAMTQLEYVQWLVQLSGDSARFTENSTGADYISWARLRGMNPKGGWQLGSKLNKDVLAQTIGQFLQLSPDSQGDYLKALAAQGISLPSGAQVSRKAMAGFVDNSLQTHTSLFRRPNSPQKPDRDRDRDNDDRPKPRDRDTDHRPGPNNGDKED